MSFITDLTNIQFVWPWLFVLLPLPVVVRFILPASSNNQDAALSVPFLHDFDSVQHNQAFVQKNRWLTFIAAVAWCLLILAATRPQWLGERVDIPVSGRDLMMAVDLSGSMQAEDFEYSGRVLNRLQAVKIVAGEFIKQREGDRIGLILFGEQAYLQTPLTFDTKTVNSMLQESLIGIAGKATAIGDAIGLSIKRLQDRAADSRVLILLTDGANTAGEVSPLKAAELAAKQNLKIYTIGVGAESREVGGLFFNRTIKNTEIDEKTLNAIADTTGGQYFRARDLNELNKIYSLIDQLEPIEQESQSFRPVQALYAWPLAFAFILAALVLIIPSLSQLVLQVKGLLPARTKQENN